MSLLHTYGPSCLHAPSVTFTGSKGDDEVPALKAQFFYSSPLPIDDPLSPVPIPTSYDATASHPPRPFSAVDSTALEGAWMSLASSTDRKNHRKVFKRSQKSRKNKDGKNTKAQEAVEGSAATSTQTSKSVETLKDMERSAETGKEKNVKSKKEEKWATLVTEIATMHRERHSKDSQESASRGTSKASAWPSKSVSDTEIKDMRRDRQKEAQDFASTDSLQTMAEGQAENTKRDRSLPTEICCADLEKDVRSAFKKNFSGILKKIEGKSADNLYEDVVCELSMTTSSPEQDNCIPSCEAGSAKPIGEAQTESAGADDGAGCVYDIEQPVVSFPDSTTGTTGLPFIRVPSRHSLTSNTPPKSLGASSSVLETEPTGASSDPAPTTDPEPNIAESSDAAVHHHGCKARNNTKALAEVPVGASRLHLVKLPALQMMPIYWSPVHDIAAVTRGTWFYRETMYPVEPSVSNRLEQGYRELRPWSRTWNDELNSALDVGAAGEEKIAHQLWPDKSDDADLGANPEDPSTASDPFCAARCFRGEVAAAGSMEGEDEPATADPMSSRRYSNAQVIYKDANNAFILKQSLQPSAYYGRRPLAKIKKGLQVGIHVVRGFDWKAWERIHPPRKTQAVMKAEDLAPASGAANALKESACPACRNQARRPKVTDLVLVIHGIGQKLSERVESYHFTHAINGFRRFVNVELANEAVQRVLSPELGGIMVLPVNWRSNVDFEEGEAVKSGKAVSSSDDGFTLQHITPATIPAVRNLISDVMLDIPFYMSHHRSKMIQALISEANRVYRLWCRNNPGFNVHGRVHFIAHSLGSAMALEVLSKQPTLVPPLELRERRKGGHEKIQTKHLDFNVTNVFFAGSPAGFFLLLDHGRLIPRRDRRKPEAEEMDVISRSVTGDAGTFGCLALDNLYNIMHCNDPIAYRLNAAVDAKYAETMKTAQVPSAATGWFESIGNAVRSLTPGMSPSNELLNPGRRPSVARLPSQLEMEVHDFSREEIAERRFHLLNDNGQIDYFLSSGGGPLEIQYLNMLGAHSSYWTSQDFVRMIVTEIGRRPGKTHALPNMKTVKQTLRK